MLSARDISFSFGQKPVLKGVSVDIQPGQFWAFVGPNGAGKTTLLKILTGMLTQTKGTVEFGGSPLASWDALHLARMRAVLTQDPQLAFNFTVLDVVRMGRSVYSAGAATPENERVCQQALQSLGLESFATRSFFELSGGEKQRVHFARVMAQIGNGEPVDGRRPYLFLDEPTNNLDLAHQHEFLRQAKSVSSKGAAVVAVLHDLNLAMNYADHVLVLEEGNVAASGDIVAQLTVPLVESVFGVSVCQGNTNIDERPFFVVRSADRKGPVSDKK